MAPERPSDGPGPPATRTGPVRGAGVALGGQTPPRAVLTPSGDVVVSAQALAELLGVLRAHRDCCRGITAPPSVPSPRWTPPLHEVTELVAAGATRYVTRGSLGSSAFVPQPNTSAASAAHLVVGVSFREGVDVAGASKIIGCSTRWIRVLCANGGLIARKHRHCWEIDAASCHAYAQNRAA